MTIPPRAFGLLALLLLVGLGAARREEARPNIVWIVSEDNSKHYLKLFDPAGAPAPHIEAMARNGLVYDRAFSNAPVCSVARTTLATACYGPRIGTQFHRRLKMAAMPEGLEMFPAYLKKAGYYTTNNSKKDYNAVEGKGVWDDSSKKASWRNRPKKDQPFFHMQSHGQSHESSLHFKANQMKPDTLTAKPADMILPPYHPDTPTFRFTHARYHDRMGVIDDIVGQTVAKLKEDGVLEETFIFYFGDHGGVLPRSKGYIYESGLHIPLVVRVPEKFKDLAGAERGTRVKGFVSFIDFGPTTLNLAGVPVPDGVDGRPFLGKGVTLEEVNGRDETYGYADRFDEKYELCRSIRKGKWKYIRFFEGYYPDGLQNNYRYRQLAYQEWRKRFKAGELDEAQRQFFEPKGPEALYDLDADPHEVRNLAGDPKHREVLTDLRGRLMKHLRGLPDLSLFPESVLVDRALDNATEFGRRHRNGIGAQLDVANLALLPFEDAQFGLKAAMEAKNPWVRYWAATSCAVFGKQAAPLAGDARKLLEDREPLVRIRAAVFLALAAGDDPRPAFRRALQTSKSHVETLIILNDLVFLRDGGPGITFDFTKKDVAQRGGQVARRLEYLGW